MDRLSSNRPDPMVCVWDLDPVGLYAVLAVSMPLEQLRMLVRSKTSGMCARCASNDTVVTMTAAKACLSRNPLSEAINRSLMRTYEAYHLEIQCALLASLRHRLTCSHYLRDNLAGFLCGLLFSSDPEKRDLGVHLGHSCALQGLTWCRGGANNSARPQPPEPPSNIVYLN